MRDSFRSVGLARCSIAILAISFLLFFTAGCRFKSPTVQEQKELVNRGSFPRGVPPWIPPAAISGKPKRLSSGFISESFSGPGNAVPARTGLSKESDSLQSDDDLEEERRTSASNTQEDVRIDLSGDTPKADDPLSRISGVCSGMETEVNDALLTVNVEQRIAKYKSLVNRCPASSDLWLWLGKEYKLQGRNVEAGRCFEKVLVIDNDNEEAESLLGEVRESG
ncbi:hypothetical protein BVY02_01050 [bacterium J17]|nr:hypothetical protein BVY02_01050 [bacterium J17]